MWSNIRFVPYWRHWAAAGVMVVCRWSVCYLWWRADEEWWRCRRLISSSRNTLMLVCKRAGQRRAFASPHASDTSLPTCTFRLLAHHLCLPPFLPPLPLPAPACLAYHYLPASSGSSFGGFAGSHLRYITGITAVARAVRLPLLHGDIHHSWASGMAAWATGRRGRAAGMWRHGGISCYLMRCSCCLTRTVAYQIAPGGWHWWRSPLRRCSMPAPRGS